MLTPLVARVTSGLFEMSRKECHIEDRQHRAVLTNATMSKVSMGNGGFYGCLIELQGVSFQHGGRKQNGTSFVDTA